MPTRRRRRLWHDTHASSGVALAAVASWVLPRPLSLRHVFIRHVAGQDCFIKDLRHLQVNNTLHGQ